MLRLLELREKTGMNQKDFAIAIGLPYTTYRNWESGRNEPDIATLIKLADYFHVTVDYLVGRTDTPESEEISHEESEPDELMETITKLALLPDGDIYIEAILSKAQEILEEEENHKKRINEILKK